MPGAVESIAISIYSLAPVYNSATSGIDPRSKGLDWLIKLNVSLVYYQLPKFIDLLAYDDLEIALVLSKLHKIVL